MNQAFFEKLTTDYKGVKYPLVRLDFSDRTVDEKRMKTKVSNETVRAFVNMITKKNQPRKIWVDRGTETAAEFKAAQK